MVEDMVKPKDGAETALEFAVELLEEYGYWSWTPYEEKRHREHVAALIEADRAAVREAAATDSGIKHLQEVLRRVDARIYELNRKLIQVRNGATGEVTSMFSTVLERRHEAALLRKLILGPPRPLAEYLAVELSTPSPKGE